MKNYDTLVEAIQDLKKEGYSYDFNLLDHAISAKNLAIAFGPKDFDVKAVFRFEGMSNPSDSSILYAIETNNGVKGILTDSYGVYSGQVSDEMMEKLNLTPRLDQDL